MLQGWFLIKFYRKMDISENNRFVIFFMTIITRYNHDKYWKRRDYVTNPEKKNVLKKLWYLLYIKRVDSYWHCTFGTGYNQGSKFSTPPTLWHGPNGIIMGYNAVIGRNVIICQRVTIEQGAPVYIGDNVLLGSNVYIKPGVKIGDNVKIGANAVVVEDIPSNSTVVMPKPRVIIRSNK